MTISLARKFLLLVVLAVAMLTILATGGSSDGGTISITFPDANATLIGTVSVTGHCSVIDQLTVVIDNDAFTRQVVDCRFGDWSADFDTTFFQDGAHALVAYASDTVRDQIPINTSNGNVSGFTVSVPVSLASGIYDEIDQYTPLFVYAKRVSTGLVIGQRFTVGTFPENYEISNVPNGVYEIGAILDRNNNLTLDPGWDFEGRASDLLEVSNANTTSGAVELSLFDGDYDNDGTVDAGGSNPADVTGSISISQPDDGVEVSGTMLVAGTVSGGGIGWVTVTLDDNLYSQKTVAVNLGHWQAQFDTTRVQDGSHTIHAAVNGDIWDQVNVTTHNGNTQGYTVNINVDLATGIYDEIDENTPLYVYVQDPVTSARQTVRFTSGVLGPDSSFDIGYVPNNTYIVGAFLDRNNNGVEDSGDYAGQAAALLDVWYADSNAYVLLVGNEVHISSPAPLTEIRANTIEMTGTYTFQPDEIIVLMRLTPVTYVSVEAPATFNNGAWSATLDITDVTQEGERQLHVKARYGASYVWDTVIVDINRTFPQGVEIIQPVDGATISTDAMTVTGNYNGDPLSLSVSLEDGAGGTLDATAILDNGSWTALFNDITSVAPGNRAIIAVADYGGGITQQDTINVTISSTPAISGVTISAPQDGDTVDSTTLVVQGSVDGTPDSVTVSIQTDDSGGTLDLQAVLVADSWSVTFDNITGVSNGLRSITALADYGGGLTAVDSINVTVDLPVPNVKSFSYRLEVTSVSDTAFGITWANSIHDCPNNVGSVALPWVREETIELPFSVPSEVRSWCQGPFSEVLIAASATVLGEDGTIKVYLNGSNSPYHTVTTYQYPYLAIKASWDGDPAHDIVFQIQ